MGRRKLFGVGVAAVALLLVTACGSSSKGATTATTATTGGTGGTTATSVGGSGGSTSGNTASAPGVTTDSITVGFETDITGIASSTFADSAQGAIARFDMQNAQGGVNGRTLRLVSVDTTSTPSGANTAAKVLVSQKGVFGVMEVSALFFGAYQYLNAQKVPVTGSSLDGPEWYMEPNTNMFNIEGTNSPNYPSYTSQGEFYKSLGVSKISFVASNTPSSTRGIKQAIYSAQAAGLHTCADTVVPLGAVDFTGIALSIKNAGCDAAECSCVLSSSLALASALQDAGLDIPSVFDAGPAQQVLSSAATIKASDGSYFPAQIFYSGSAYNSFTSALKQYDSAYTGGLPDLGLIDGWQAADLFIKGLQVAGQNPTRQSFISNLRQVSSWDANGLRPAPVSFTNFGQAPATYCFAYLKFQNSQYTAYPSNGKPYCGTLIPNSNAS
jgi:branched-chain amino acid transport system substrate-binding protein